MSDLPKPIPRPGPWIDEALCRKVEPYERREQIFFPIVVPRAPRDVSPAEYERRQAHIAKRNPDVRAGKAVCRECPVRRECGLYAVENRIEHGTWGGISEWERRSKPGRPKKRLPDEVVLTAGRDYCPYCSGTTTAPRGPRQMYCLDCHTTWQIPKRKVKDEQEELQPRDGDLDNPEAGGREPVPAVLPGSLGEVSGHHREHQPA